MDLNHCMLVGPLNKEEIPTDMVGIFRAHICYNTSRLKLQKAAKDGGR